jgi:hypothetical protein
MNEDERQRHLQDAAKWARRAERASTVAMWGSGCALALWALGILLGIAVGVWVFLTLTS